MEIDAGRWRARVIAWGEASSALALRNRVFRQGRSDRDAFDATARHITIDGPEGIAACARIMVQRGPQVCAGYAAQFYDLTRFASAFGPAMEVGRICLAPGVTDAEVPRLLLATLARLVEAEAVEVLYGCSSFPLDTGALGALRNRVAPTDWAPGRLGQEVRPLSGPGGTMPPLLRSYLSLGARVSDHAVVDRDLNTVHVFTALPIADIPPNRARLLTGMLASV